MIDLSTTFSPHCHSLKCPSSYSADVSSSSWSTDNDDIVCEMAQTLKEEEEDPDGVGSGENGIPCIQIVPSSSSSTSAAAPFLFSPPDDGPADIRFIEDKIYSL